MSRIPILRKRWKWIVLILVLLVLPPTFVELHRRHRQKLMREVIVRGGVAIVHAERVPDWLIRFIRRYDTDRFDRLIYRSETAVFPAGGSPEASRVKKAADAVNRFGSIRAVRLREQAEIERGVLEALATWHGVERVYLTSSGITDEHLEEVAGLQGLREVDLDNNPVTVAGVKHLAALPNLQRLSLIGTDVGGSELVTTLKSIPTLAEVRLSESAVPDAKTQQSLSKALPGVSLRVYAEGDVAPKWK